MTYGGSRRADLAARLRRSQRALKARLERPDTALGLLRAAHDTLEPEVIGGLAIEYADEWFKAAACGVFAADLDGQVVALSSRGLGTATTPPAVGVARWVLTHGREFTSADLRKDPRVNGAAGAAFGLPLRCRARTVAALVVVERQAATEAPRFTPAVVEMLRAILEGTAQALYGTGIGAVSAAVMMSSGALYAELRGAAFWIMSMVCTIALPLILRLARLSPLH